MKDIWVVRHALTKGIVETTYDDCLHYDKDSNYIWVVWPENPTGLALFKRNETAETKEEAAIMAEQIRCRRVASLERSLTKARNFELKWVKFS